MKILHKIFVLSVFCLMAGFTSIAAANREHVVRPGDTLYSLARLYGVTVEAIQAANPMIEGTNIPTGMTLVIPDEKASTEKSEQKSKSPLSFANKQDTNKQDKKTTENPAGTSTIITSVVVNKPSTQVVAPVVEFKNKPTLPTYNVLGNGHWTDGTLSVAVILPFHLNAKTADDKKAQMRSVEFYQGVLLAVDEIQQTGRRVSVMTFDTESQSMQSILNSQSLLTADFIIAPMDEAKVKPIADWAEEHGTPVVSPFVFNANMLNQYEHLLQINTTKSMLYPQLTEDLTTRFKSYTFVFLTDSLVNKSDPYPALLKQELRAKGIKYKDLSYHRSERLMACDSILGIMNEDIIFVPVTPQQASLRRMFSGLQHVKILRDSRFQEALTKGSATKPQPKMAVLGYPEWILYTNDFIDYYYDLNVYLFTKLYVNPFDPFVKRFYDNFKNWYHKELMSLVPKYGILGYDVTRFFLRSLSRHGQHIEERIVGQEEECLQNVFCFERGENGKGLYNHGLYLVHFLPESSIEKIIIK